MRRLLPIALALALLAPAAPAHADGDPASDILLAQDVFLPYAPNEVSAAMAAALKTTVSRAKRRGFGVKVALIADERDLGSVAQLLTEPQRYADLLTTELSLNVVHGDRLKAPRVLTVLPGGLGGNNLGDTAGDALTGLTPVADEGPDGLARTAALAIDRLAAAAGTPIELPALPDAAGAAASDGGRGGGIPAAVLFGAPVILLALVVVGLNARMGRADAAPADPHAAA